MPNTLLSFGHGYTARALSRRLISKDWAIFGTTRKQEKLSDLDSEGIIPLLWPGQGLDRAFERATHLLVSAGPGAEGDPMLREFKREMAALAPKLKWAGYLSTTGVYGDHLGGWVDEDTPLTPSTERGVARMKAETDWRSVAGLPLHIFRLAGIYGPGRGPFEKVRKGTARRIVKPGQVFSRIHVEDIASVLEASIANPDPGAIYNVCDDDPAPPQDVIAYAAELLELPPPPEVDFDSARMSAMARSFYAESKRVDNTRIKNDLGVKLAYPNYRVGLRSLLACTG